MGCAGGVRSKAIRIVERRFLGVPETVSGRKGHLFQIVRKVFFVFLFCYCFNVLSCSFLFLCGGGGCGQNYVSLFGRLGRK